MKSNRLMKSISLLAGLAVSVCLCVSATATEAGHEVTLSQIQASASSPILTNGELLFEPVPVLIVARDEFDTANRLTLVVDKNIGTHERITKFGNRKPMSTSVYNTALVSQSLDAQEVGWRKQSAYSF
jgi:hypothetical protein